MATKRPTSNGLVDIHEPLDRGRIVQAAIKLLNQVGLHQLTMRRLAESLGIRAASLYWHVSDKGELMQLLSDTICERISIPDQSLPWREQVLLLAGQYREVLHSIRDSAEIMLDTPPATPKRLRLIEAVGQIFVRAGFPPEEVFSAGGLVNNFVLSFAMDGMRMVRMANDRGRSVEEEHRQFRHMLKTLPPEEYPTLVRYADYCARPDEDSQFQFGLQVLLDGLAARLAASSKSTTKL